MKKINLKKLAFIFVLILLFLILSHDRLHQWDEACFLSEAAYDKDYGFSCFPFDHFRLHIIILTSLVNIFGEGVNALFFIDLIYAFFMLITIINLYLFSKILFEDKRKAQYIALIGLFLPITLYLAFKSISSVPALMFASFALVFTVKGLKEKNNKFKILFFIGAGIIIYLSSISRFDGPILIYSFLGALLVMNLIKKPIQNIKLKNIFVSLVVISLVFLICFLTIFISTGFNGHERFIPSKTIYNILHMDYNESELPSTYEQYNVKREEIINQDLSSLTKLYLWTKTITGNFIKNSLLNFSLFGIFMIFSLMNLKNKNVIFSWVFYFLTLLPVALITRFGESRYSYLSLIPLAIIIYFGIEYLFKNKLFNKNKLLIVSVFTLIVLLNLTFIGYMEANVSEKNYDVLISRLEESYDPFSILVPRQWSDYSYLKYAYPTLDIYSVQKVDDGTLTIVDTDKIKNVTQIKTISNEKIYICYEKFRYVSYLEKAVAGIDLFNRTRTESQCSEGWIWNNTNLNLQKIMQEGRYEAYLVTIK